MIHCAQGFAPIPNEILRDPTLSPTVKTLYCVGATFLRAGAGTIFPSYRTLAKLCGFSRSTAIRAARVLENLGLWKVERRRDEETMTCQTNLVTYAAPGSTVQPPSSTVQPLPVAQVDPKQNQSHQDPVTKGDRAYARETPSVWGGRVREGKSRLTGPEKAEAIIKSILGRRGDGCPTTG